MKRRDFLICSAATAGWALAGSTTSQGAPRYPILIDRDRVVLGPERARIATGNWRTVQEAIHVALAKRATLELLPGVYRTASQLTIEGPLLIRGVAGKSILEATHNVALNLDIRPGVTGARVSTVSLQGLTFLGKGLPHGCPVDATQRPICTLPSALNGFNGLVTAYRVDNLSIEDCSFDGGSGAALALWECRQADVSRNAITRSRIAFFSHTGQGNVFSGNRIAQSVDLGVYIAHHA